MYNYQEFSERTPRNEMAIFVRNQELNIDILGVFNVTHRLVVTESFLVFKPNKSLEWRYATEKEVSISKGFKPLINQ